MGLLGCDYLETVGTVFPEYRCKLSRQQLNSYTAQNICMTSRYADCADYKNSSGCFITTAVCLSMGKADDCEELIAMRLFRDKWLQNQPDGAELIEDYYRTAPAIVEKKISSLTGSQFTLQFTESTYCLALSVSKLRSSLIASESMLKW